MAQLARWFDTWVARVSSCYAPRERILHHRHCGDLAFIKYSLHGIGRTCAANPSVARRVARHTDRACALRNTQQMVAPTTGRTRGYRRRATSMTGGSANVLMRFVHSCVHQTVFLAHRESFSRQPSGHGAARLQADIASLACDTVYDGEVGNDRRCRLTDRRGPDVGGLRPLRYKIKSGVCSAVASRRAQRRAGIPLGG